MDAPVVDLGDVDHLGSRHLGSDVAATPAIVRWFGELSRRPHLPTIADRSVDGGHASD
ncbi:hypothetical protein [Streptomyces sp. NBC_00887]|uniref:hypothetical protein n=1 Tax=Streptomyces sp. NBC_00887 TaxID=2975859 RepID=UPI00386EAFEC|nr:hypothetical protein OG844_11340 [Streptomyces sp. NBC_00887]